MCAIVWNIWPCFYLDLKPENLVDVSMSINTILEKVTCHKFEKCGIWHDYTISRNGLLLIRWTLIGFYTSTFSCTIFIFLLIWFSCHGSFWCHPLSLIMSWRHELKESYIYRQILYAQKETTTENYVSLFVFTFFSST